MTGYIQWPPEQEFKPGDVVMNGGMFWQMDDAGEWHIIDDSENLPICDGCGQPQQPDVLGPHQHECEGGRHGESS